MQFRKRLPSLTALVTLEAVVRRKSFTLAASELGVTQAAVSRQIAALEEELGQPLFLRKHRAIEPTAACVSLGATLAKSFADIAESVEAIQSRGQDVVTIGATVAFSSFWLLPRLAEFRRANPGILVRVISQDSPIALDDGEIDVAIRYGMPPFSDGTVIASRGDPVSAVARCPENVGNAFGVQLLEREMVVVFGTRRIVDIDVEHSFGRYMRGNRRELRSRAIISY